MNALLQDLRYGLRMLAKAPGFTAIAILTLALGIGANTAIFSVVNTVLLARLPYKDVDRIAWVWGTNSREGENYGIPVSPGDFTGWQQKNTVFDSLVAGVDDEVTLTGAGEPQMLVGYAFSSNYFTTLGVSPELGRTFTQAEDRPGAPHVIVLADELWRGTFHADRGIIGRSITLDGEPYTVIGVMPPGFNYGSPNMFWVPFGPFMTSASDYDHQYVRVIAKLKSGVSVAQAQAQMGAIQRQIDAEHPATDAGNGIMINSLRKELTGDIRMPLLILLGAVGFVLLIACANVASLLLSRVASRKKEIAIRAAIGASRARICRQFLTESLLLSVSGGVLGIFLAEWCTNFLVTIFPNDIANLNIPKVTAVPVDGRVLLFALVVTLLTGLAFGVVPAMQSARANAGEALKESGRSATSGAGTARLHRGLVVAEIALSLVLLAGAGLLIESFQRLAGSSLGFEPSHTAALEVFLPPNRYPSSHPEKYRAFTDNVIEKLKSLPGVQSAGATNFLPLTGFWGSLSFYVEDRPIAKPSEMPSADNRLATPEYFSSMGIPLLRGREFTAADQAGAQQVVIVNAALASRYFGDEDPLGKQLNLGTQAKPDWWSIVGVVGDVKAFGPDKSAHADLYRPADQVWFPLLSFTVRTAGDPAAMLKSFEQAVWTTDKDEPISKATPMSVLAAQSVALRRVSMILIAAFAALALSLAAVGIYGVMAFAVAQRTNEFGIRMALGAQQGDVLRLVLGQGTKLTLAGLVIGVIAALALTRLMSSLLFGISATDPLTFAGGAAVLTVVALAACYIPARRAMRVDPIIALRYE